jgi:membrane protein implicated in regulation of membrane protease activity
MKRFLLGLLCILFLFALWWAALWFVLPVDWLQGTQASFVAIHVAPPSSVILTWMIWKLFKSSRKKAQRTTAEGEQEALRIANQEERALARAHVECRGLWVALSKAPDWMREAVKHCTFLEEETDELQGNDLEVALTASLEQLFEVAFRQNEALVWLPVFLAHDGIQVEWVENAWKQALWSGRFARHPAVLDCQMLPGTGNMAARIINLFGSEHSPPALVLGMDSTLDARRTSNAGHAVLAFLFSQPGLDALPTGPDDDAPVKQETDSYTPYWEHDFKTGSSPHWGNIPSSLRQGFLSRYAAFATLHRPVDDIGERDELMGSQTRALKQQIHDALPEAFIRAGLREPPFKETELPEIGWLVHDSHDTARFVAIASALADYKCALNPVLEASNLREECGDVGAAREALMLAGATIRAAQLEKPILLVGSGEGGATTVGVLRPCTSIG